jgi:peptide/nickel transport system substrate-binding protein
MDAETDVVRKEMPMRVRLVSVTTARLMVVRATAVVAAIAMATAACGSDAPDEAGGAGAAKGSRPSDTLVLGLSYEPDSFNPILGYASKGGGKIFDGLMARDADLNLVPALAAELPNVSADGETITFRLRDGVTFHDGEPLNADDVVFTYSSILDPKVNTDLRSALEALESVEAPDDRTVVFHLKYAYPAFVQRTVIGIAPRHALEGTDINTAPFNTKPIGTGPFVVESSTPGDKLVLRANEDYWGGAPALKRVVMAFVEDDNARAARLAAGELDATDLPPKAATRFRGREGYEVHDVPSADYRGVMFPLEQPVTGDIAIRRALDLALDRDAIVEGILQGAGEPAFGPISPLTRWFNPDVAKGRPSGGDPAAAKKVLDDAGWRPGAGGVREKDGRRAAFTLMYPASDALRKDLALAVASAAKEVGIEVEVVGLDWDAITPRMGRDALIMG